MGRKRTQVFRIVGECNWLSACICVNLRPNLGEENKYDCSFITGP
jgi:hypothetical protein